MLERIDPFRLGYDPQVIAIDLDGTLLNDESQVSPRTKATLRAALDAGITIVIATGRNYRDALRLLAGFEQELLYVLYNGAVIRSYDSLRRINAMNQDLVLELIKDFREQGVTPIVYNTEGARYVQLHDGVDPVFSTILQDCPASFTVVPDLFTIAESPIIRVGIWNSEERTTALFRHVLDRYAERVVAYNFPFDFWILEVLNPLSNKGYALEWLSSNLGVPLERITAIGNHYNDITMLKTAGLGVAVKNALPEVIAAADLVIPSNNDAGVAAFLEAVLAHRTTSGVQGVHGSWGGTSSFTTQS